MYSLIITPSILHHLVLIWNGQDADDLLGVQIPETSKVFNSIVSECLEGIE